jgi:hypothetical protein
MENQDDIKKYFDENQYITKIVGAEEETAAPKVDNDKIALLISLLTDPKNKEFKEEALLTLKKEKGGHLLLAAILKTKENDKKQQLVAACWESEIDFTSYLPFFVDLAITSDYLVTLEAITVIETMEGTFNREHLSQAIEKIKLHKKTLTNELLVLFNDLEINLTEKFSLL